MRFQCITLAHEGLGRDDTQHAAPYTLSKALRGGK